MAYFFFVALHMGTAFEDSHDIIDAHTRFFSQD